MRPPVGFLAVSSWEDTHFACFLRDKTLNAFSQQRYRLLRRSIWTCLRKVAALSVEGVYGVHSQPGFYQMSMDGVLGI
jgi:hypothetical protein